jgi:hypothetical protein
MDVVEGRAAFVAKFNAAATFDRRRRRIKFWLTLVFPRQSGSRSRDAMLFHGTSSKGARCCKGHRHGARRFD